MTRCDHIENLVRCKTRALYGIFGDKPSKCGQHKTEDMEDIKHKKCDFPRCRTQPVYGLPGKSATRCSEHKIEGMEDVKNKKCDFPGCRTRANFGLPGSKLATKCSEHKIEGMEDVKNKKCNFPGCKTLPVYGLPGSKKATKCGQHKSNDMEDVVSKKCDFPGCKTHPNFGLPGSKTATKCSDHKTDVMVDVRHKKCDFPGCKTDDMVDIKNKNCMSCGFFQVVKSSNYLCGYCRPQTVVRAKKERIVKDVLEAKIPEYKFIHNKQINNDCCLKYRPDFLFGRGSYYLIAECDENGHETYDKDCEIIRMNNISSGLGLPTKFIRYNPDLKGVKTKIKHKKLIETLKYWLNLEFLDDPSALYLFYS